MLSTTPYTLPPTPFLLALGVALIATALVIVFLWRHKKAGMGKIELVGKIGLVESALEPEGSVIIDGELWRAFVRSGSISKGERVRVVGASGHLLEVELAAT